MNKFFLSIFLLLHRISDIKAAIKKTFLLFILLVSSPLFAQQTANISTFHRLLIFNDKSELMLVRIKDSDRWVTPGWYQDEQLTIKQGLEQLAGSYGVKISSPVLRGVFTLKDGQSRVISTRLIYSTKITSGTPEAPPIIGEIKWLPVQEAAKIVTYSHISTQFMQITKYPNIVWGGTQYMPQDNSTSKSEIDAFYPLLNMSK